MVAPLKPTKLTPELAQDLSENVLAKILRDEIGYLPLVASLRVALLLGAKVGDSDLVDDLSSKKAKEIVTQTLDYWTKKSSDVSRLLKSISVAMIKISHIQLVTWM